MLIRRARAEDAADVADIYNQGITARTATFETTLRTADDRRRVIETQGDRYPIIVAEDGGRIIGWASLSEHSSRACYRGIAECSVYVAEGQQGKGVGSQLMTALIDTASALGYWKLVSRAFLFNEASRAMCRRAAFREVGIYERHAKLDDEWLDVVIVERLIRENQQ